MTHDIDYEILPERPQDDALIPSLLDRTFGPDRHAKTVYRLREAMPPVPELCFSAVARKAGRADGRLLATLRFWPILIEPASTAARASALPAILLGPLAVEPMLQGRGIGRALVRHGLQVAKRCGHRVCVVVGEPGYYRPYGFESAPARGLILPGPVDPVRFQVLELVAGALEGPEGPWAGMIHRAPEPKPGAARRWLRPDGGAVA